MLVNRYQTVYLSFISTDLPVWNVVKAKASMFQKDREKFHLLLNQQDLPTSEGDISSQGLFWLEISPYRVMMTMQSNGRLSYRHYWEKGVYGVSRYCLNTPTNLPSKSIRLQNYTRYLKVEGDIFPKSIRLEYELRSDRVQLGNYILHLDIEQ